MEVMKENRVEEVQYTAPPCLLSLPLFIALQVVLETEYDNAAALSLYESLGFIREKRLFRFYLNGKDAFRLVLEMPVSDDDDEFRSDKSPYPKRSPSSGLPYRAIQISPYSDDDDDESSR